MNASGPCDGVTKRLRLGLAPQRSREYFPAGRGDRQLFVTASHADPAVWLEYFEHFAAGKGPEDEFVRGLALLRRWQVMAESRRVDNSEVVEILELLEAEEDPGSGWYGAWNRMVAWGVAHGLTMPRPNPWAAD